jgi:hypothetical protein
VSWIHGRPRCAYIGTMPGNGVVRYPADTEMEQEFRRCHSQMVWQAIQAVVAIAVADEMAREEEIASADESRFYEDMGYDI